MSIKRYIASKDNTITNAYKENLVTRAFDANMGESDVLEVFSILGQSAADSIEQSRILIQFPVEKIKEDRENEKMPGSGSVQFIVKLSNTPHPFTLPKKFSLFINPVSSSWDEGIGLDMENYKDVGYSNWVSSSTFQGWTNEGGDYYEDIEYSHYFEKGTEDLEVDITELVEKWISEEIPNNGLIIRVSSSNPEISVSPEDQSFYTKKFFARGSEYFYKKPWIEARWDSTVKDDRGKFFLYNPFVPQEFNYNTLYIHNRFRGELYDLPTVGTGSIYVRLYSSPNLPLGSPLNLLNGETVATGSWNSTGIYSAQIGINTEYQKVYDVWFDSNGTAIGFGGEIEIINSDYEENYTKGSYNFAIKRLNPVYYNHENPRLHLFIRPEKWYPNSYTSLTTNQQNLIVDNVYYRVFRIVDGLEIIPYGTGSYNHTRLSYDKNGNYMDLDMSLFEVGYSYGLKFSVYDSGQYFESKELFKFRVED